MSGRVGVEQTPDIEAAVAEAWIEQAIADEMPPDTHDAEWRAANAAAVIRQALAPVLSAAVREARAAACSGSRPWRKGDADTRCQACGHEYEPWFTDHWLWNTVIGGEDCDADPGGFLCFTCFQRRADERWPNLVWRCFPQWTRPSTDHASSARDAEARALREAADSFAEHRDWAYPYLVECQQWLRDRADRIAVDTPEGGEGR